MTNVRTICLALVMSAAFLVRPSLADQETSAEFAKRWVQLWHVYVALVPDHVKDPEAYREAEIKRLKEARAEMDRKFTALTEENKSAVLRALLHTIPGKYDSGAAYNSEAQAAAEILEAHPEGLTIILNDKDRAWFRESLKKGPEKESELVLKLISAAKDESFIGELTDSLYVRKALLSDKLRTLVSLGDSKGLRKALETFLGEKSPTDPAPYVFEQLVEASSPETKILVLKRLISALSNAKETETALSLLKVLTSSHLVQKDLAENLKAAWSQSPRDHDKTSSLIGILDHDKLTKDTAREVEKIAKELLDQKDTSQWTKENLISLLSKIPESTFDQLQPWALDPKSHNYSSTNEAIRAMMTLPDRREEFLGKAVTALTQSWGGADHPSFLWTLEEARGNLPLVEQTKLDSKINEALPFSRKHEKKACSVLCGLVENFEKWSKSAGAVKDDESRAQNAAAVYALGMLFMTKAAPFCPKAKTLVKEWVASGKVFNALTEESKPSPDTHAMLMRKVEKGELDLSEEQLKKLNDFIAAATPSGMLNRSTPIYAKQFIIGTLLELERQGLISPEDAIIPRYKAEAGLVSELSSFKKFESVKTWGSLYNTFALATSALHVREIPKTAAEGMLAMERESPLEVPYLPWKENAQYQAATPRGSAARAVPYHMALYRIESDPGEKSKRLENVISAIKNFTEHSGALQLHAVTEIGERRSPHTGEDGLAAYYYYPGVAYAASAAKILLKEQSLSESQRDELKKYLEQIQHHLLSLESGGLFETANLDFMSYGNGSFANPMAGLAIIATIENCNDVSAASHYGIIDPSLAKFGSSSKQRKPSETGKANPMSLDRQRVH